MEILSKGKGVCVCVCKLSVSGHSKTGKMILVVLKYSQLQHNIGIS